MRLDAEIVVIGAGFAGLGLAIRLREAGFDSVLVLERADEVGGTWRENAYPGCACDIPSMLYSFSFERNQAWSRVYPQRQEIWEYLVRASHRDGLRSRIRFGIDVTRAAYDETRAVWSVHARDGTTVRCRVLVAAMGPLNKPHVPPFAGLERFAGRAFHSSRWDGSVDLRDKHVAIVGTGASAIQIVPEIAPLAASLALYQRTAPWVIPRNDSVVGPLRRVLRRAIPGYAWAVRQAIYWILELRALGFTVNPKLLESQERIALDHLERQIPEAELRDRVRPADRMGCKRVLISDDYYPALRRENVEVVADEIAEIAERDIVTVDGRRRPADVIVLATGFRATEGLVPVQIFGRDGVELGAAWRDGAEAYLGTNVAGFPNLFLLIGPNTGLGHNSMIVMMEAQYAYVLDALRVMRERALVALDVKRDVQSRFNRALQRRMARTVWATGCRSWYLDARGKNTTLWPGFTFAYRLATRRIRPERYEAFRAASYPASTESEAAAASTV